jgi:hypothetical protein
MTETYKNLGQAKPAAGSLDDAFTCGGIGCVVSSIVVANTGGVSDYFRIAHAVGGAANNIKQYLYYDIEVVTADTFIATVGITMAPTDILRVRSSNGLSAFNFYGTELS